MFLENEKIRLVLANTYNMGGEKAETMEESTLVIELPTKDENLIIPSYALKFELWEIHEGKNAYAQLVHRIFIGSISSIEKMQSDKVSFLYSRGLDCRDLNNFKDGDPCVVYRTGKDSYDIIAKMQDSDIVVNDTEELKMLITLLSNEFYEVKSSVKRVRNIKNNFKRL